MNRRFSGSLNVLLAGSVLLTVTVGWILVIPLTWIAFTPVMMNTRVPDFVLAALYHLAIPVMIGAFLVYRWVRRGSLEPELGEPSNPRRYRLGHALLLAFNLMSLASFVSTATLMRLDSVHDSVGNAVGDAGMAQFMSSLLVVGILLGVAGAWVLWSSRRPPSGS